MAQQIYEFHSGQVLLVEPNVEELPNSFEKRAPDDFSEALAFADIHVLLVDHDAFKSAVPKQGEIIDTRGIWR